MGFLNFFRGSHDKISQDLTEIVFHRSADKPISDICIDLKLSEREIDRLKFSILIINISIALWLVNKFSSDIIIAKKIIDKLFNYCFEIFRNMTKSICISDYIVYKPEITYLKKEYSVEKMTCTDYYSLFGMIHTRRIPQYVEVLEKESKRMTEPLSFWMSPLAHLFNTHFAGNKKDDPDILISILFLDIFDNLMNYCKKNLKNI